MEKLVDIVNVIDACATARENTGIFPIARVHCKYDGIDDSFWFTNDCVKYYQYNEVRKFGHFVPKNSYVAVKLQTIDVGSIFEYDQIIYKKRVQHHNVILENRSNFQDQTISIAGDPMLYQYRNIKEFLTALQQNKEDIDDIENQIAELKNLVANLKHQDNTSYKRGQITKSINELQKEYRILTQQQEDLKNITIYIRKQGEMRYSPIVDTIQTRIKTQNLFDGKTIIINGGPGTGKSTTLIHRLAYLTDLYAIDEDEKEGFFKYDLKPQQRDQLREAIKAQRDWIFFSPSPKLREYLAIAMTREGLKNTYQKVWNWEDYCRMVLRDNYGLIGDDTSNAPFRICLLKDTLFYQDCNIVTEFINFYLSYFRSIKEQLPELKSDTPAFAWTAIAKGIRQKIQDCDNYNLGNFVALFNSLESVYADDCKNLLREKNELIGKLATELCDLLERDNVTKTTIEDLLNLSSNESDEMIEEGAEEVSSEEKIDNLKLKSFVESWIKAYCYYKVNKEARISDVQLLTSEILLPFLGDKYDGQINKIGEMMIFEQYAQYTKGVKAVMLNGLPAKYRRFRTYLSKSKLEGCNLKLLREIMHRKQGKELHYQELSLLLGFINTLVKQIKGSTQSPINHIYVKAFEEVSRPIIGIDEATDFSVCEIYAMQSLLMKEFGSLTLCGDMMQRLTSYGIKSWTELNGIVPNPTVVEMKTSYRQSTKLLAVAKQIYTDIMGEMPTYKAFMKYNKVPSPLVYIDDNEYLKVKWISKRVSEVYRAYGNQLPSIAIFVNDKGYIPKFIENLKETEFFTKNRILVLDGSDANSKINEDHICVYPIDVVKGMEFDVVFFHNIDNYSVDTEMMKRYIYVGVSRAAFFLGITMSEQNYEISKYFEKDRDWFKI